MYKYSVVTFLDILGFRSIVAESSFDEVDNLLNLIVKKNRMTSDYTTDSVSLSDSIVRISPIDVSDNLPLLHFILKEVTEVSRIQYDLTKLNILIRGGLASGDIYNDNNKLFGPGLVSAYDLEANFSIYPRITIAPSFLENARQCAVYENPEQHEIILKHLASYITLSEDGLFFVDYLYSSLFKKSITEKISALQDHKNFIIQKYDQLRIGKSERFNPIIQKYYWLMNYHNKCVDKLLESPEQSLIIKNSFIENI